ncbi:hypothetical protein JX265_013668 [Neoarthrinium moseri]|uniref:Cytochrome P450 n=1 Tax=Neoarthrinium moseri TaxID=1658444 RepID=A0A9P9W8K9_9PEZI|nr:hypothetical protein JX265_013668 [Neoarthrinium moseri]
MDTIKPLLSTGIAVATFLVSCILLNHKILCDASSKTIPHGPSGVPILGSFPFLARYPELTLDKWARKFGDLYSVWLGGQLFMIISSPEVAKDLMVTHGSVFSSRKEMFIKGQTILKGRGVTATPYNDTWKHRCLVTNWLRADETAKYVLTIEHFHAQPQLDRHCTINWRAYLCSLKSPELAFNDPRVERDIEIIVATNMEQVHNPPTNTHDLVHRDDDNSIQDVTSNAQTKQCLPPPGPRHDVLQTSSNTGNTSRRTTPCIDLDAINLHATNGDLESLPAATNDTVKEANCRLPVVKCPTLDLYDQAVAAKKHVDKIKSGTSVFIKKFYALAGYELSKYRQGDRTADELEAILRKTSTTLGDVDWQVDMSLRYMQAWDRLHGITLTTDKDQEQSSRRLKKLGKMMYRISGRLVRD